MLQSIFHKLRQWLTVVNWGLRLRAAMLKFQRRLPRSASDWLLTCSMLRPTQIISDSNGQVTACTCRHRHLEVWPRPGSDTAWRTSLAWRPLPGVFQAGSDSSPLSERLRIAVPVGLLRPGFRCWHSAAPAFRQTSITCSTLLPAQHSTLQPSGLFSCRLQSLELSPGFHLGPDHQCRLFQTLA